MNRYAAVTLAAAGTLFAAACADNATQSALGPDSRGPNLDVAGPITGAVFTGDLSCQAVNKNIYESKTDVYVNGGPATGTPMKAGTYWVRVTEPGGTVLGTSPTDNLTLDAQGKVTGGCTQLFNLLTETGAVGGTVGYRTTTNGGGVYILAICGNDTFAPNICKYDAFKVRSTDDTRTEADAPTVIKDADGAFNNKYGWTITKAVDKTRVEQVGGNATFNYTVVVTRDAGAISGIKVTGTINAFNPNSGSITGVTLADELSGVSGASCTIDGKASPSTGLTLVSGANTFPYVCSISGTTVPTSPVNNKVTLSWGAQKVGDKDLAIGTVDWTVSSILFTANVIDGSVTVTDTFNGATTTLGVVPPFDAGSTTTKKTFSYPQVVAVPSYGCPVYNNTATFTTNTTGATGSASESVTVCGAGARTMGFWQGPNGQSVITAAGPATGTCSVTTFLRTFKPFVESALSATANCASAATYVKTVISSANAGKATMAAMLKAQLLATALDV